MPVQRTFTLIQPVSGPAGGDSPRPMTSKQVRKAYKDANRAPKLSRAERIKQEKAEQERIRKELERDKAATRARAAREKRQDKELAERELKKKKGLPLVSVRPSQDTIARFVRGNGTGRKRDAAGRHVVEGVADAALQLGEGTAEGHPGPGGRRDELDFLIPEEDELELGMLEQLETINHKHETEPANEDSKAAASRHRPLSQTRQATTYELDLGLRPSTPRAVPPQEPEPAGPPAHGRPVEPASPPRQAPPLSTQAILYNIDDFFPSSSQQERELQDEKTADASAERAKQQQQQQHQPARPDRTTSPTAKRFFTSSGSQELISLALQRSRRTAALEEIHQKERLRSPAAARQTTKRDAGGRPTRLQWTTTGKAPKRPTKTETAANKENVAPPQADAPGAAPSASQETEYGGEWVDEIASELTI